MELSTASVYPSPGAGAGAGGERGIDEEIKPYKIHVSSKYLDLTKKKLELTRLPHELLLPKEREWELGTPKGEVEPLVDFWLEHYDWRTRETHINATIPQFRTAISIPDSPHPLRVYFIHLRSSHSNAIPLLLVPSFPLTNLTLAPLFASLTDPPAGAQAFHLVVPSLPGLGFSDAFQTDERLLEKTAGLCDGLMRRLGYEFYLASGTGSGKESPGGMDYYLLRLLVEEHAGSCLGVHLIDPCVTPPTIATQPWNWFKFAIARFFNAEIFGYQKQDFASLSIQAKTTTRMWTGGVGMLGLTQPNTLSYALCDSPVGLLSFVCAGLRRMNPGHGFSKMEVVDLAQLAWLPGPEAGMRFVSTATQEVNALKRTKVVGRGKRKSRVVVTVFDAGDGEANEAGYSCPAWANERHEVLWSQRIAGRAGLVVWEKIDVVVEGIRSLATAVLKVDGRLGVSALDEVVIHSNEDGEEVADDGAVVEVREIGSVDGDWEDGEDDEEEGAGLQLDVESPDTVVAVSLGK